MFIWHFTKRNVVVEHQNTFPPFALLLIIYFVHKQEAYEQPLLPFTASIVEQAWWIIYIGVFFSFSCPHASWMTMINIRVMGSSEHLSPIFLFFSFLFYHHHSITCIMDDHDQLKGNKAQMNTCHQHFLF